MPLSSQARTILEQGLWLRSIDPAFAAAVLDAARTLQAPKGQLIYEILDPVGGLYGVVSGLVAARLDLDHAEVLTAHAFGPGDWFGEASFITGMPRQVTTAALSDCNLAYVSKADLQEICDNTPSGWRSIGSQSAISTGVAARVARNLLISDPRRRVRSVLTDLSGPESARRDLPLTQNDLAEMCALSRSAISKILHEFETCGFCQRKYGRIVILDGLFEGVMP